MNGTEPLPRPQKPGQDRRRAPASAGLASRSLTRADCLELLLLAFRDLADRDDIHQADARLKSVCRWIRGEAAQAAADPSLAEPRRPPLRGAACGSRQRRSVPHQGSRDGWPTL